MILIDSNVIIAAFNKRDKNHTKCGRFLEEALRGKYGVPAVSDYVIDEVLTYASKRLGKEASLKLGKAFFELNLFRIIPTTLDIVIKAWECFKEHVPNLSFTDCTILEIARTYKVDYIVTLDHKLASLYPSMGC